jgi:hypothetical protein
MIRTRIRTLDPGFITSITTITNRIIDETRRNFGFDGGTHELSFTGTGEGFIGLIWTIAIVVVVIGSRDGACSPRKGDQDPPDHQRILRVYVELDGTVG